MTATEFRAILAELEMTQTGIADLLGYQARTARHWASGDQGIPSAVAILLRLLLAGRITPHSVTVAKIEPLKW